MGREQQKKKVEAEQFLDFIKKLPFNFSYRKFEPGNSKLTPPEPDIICFTKGKESIGFELAEVCFPEVLEAVSVRYKLSTLPKDRDINGNQISLFNKKVRKSYSENIDVHLVLYSLKGWSEDDKSIIDDIRPYVKTNTGQFKSIWFNGYKLYNLFNPNQLQIKTTDY